MKDVTVEYPESKFPEGYYTTPVDANLNLRRSGVKACEVASGDYCKNGIKTEGISWVGSVIANPEKIDKKLVYNYTLNGEVDEASTGSKTNYGTLAGDSACTISTGICVGPGFAVVRLKDTRYKLVGDEAQIPAGTTKTKSTPSSVASYFKFQASVPYATGSRDTISIQMDTDADSNLFELFTMNDVDGTPAIDTGLSPVYYLRTKTQDIEAGISLTDYESRFPNGYLKDQTPYRPRVVITASSGGKVKYAKYCEVQVYITNVNEAPSLKALAPSIFTILEHSIAGTTITQTSETALTASDPDYPTYFEWSAEKGNCLQGTTNCALDYFTITCAGQLRVRQAIPTLFPNQGPYELYVQVQDDGVVPRPLKSPTTMTVRIQTINQNDPPALPVPETATTQTLLNIYENAPSCNPTSDSFSTCPPGSTAGKIIATDPDLDPLTYTMLRSTDDAFGIIKNTGEVYLVQGKKLDYENRAYYEIYVECADAYLSVRQTYKFYIKDDNDPPVPTPNMM